MMLMLRVNEEVGAIESVPLGVVIRKSPLRSEGLPRVIEMKMHERDQEGEMRAGDLSRFLVDHDELPFGKDPVMSRQFLNRVGTLRRVDHFADRGNLGVIPLGHQPEGISVGEMECSFIHG